MQNVVHITNVLIYLYWIRVAQAILPVGNDAVVDTCPETGTWSPWHRHLTETQIDNSCIILPMIAFHFIE